MISFPININIIMPRNADIILLENLYEKVCRYATCKECGKPMTYNDLVYESGDTTDCNGVIVYEGPKYVCIATNLFKPSQNEKTGPMIQVTMMRSDMSPTQAIKTGADATICFACKHRGMSCYVNVAQSVESIYKTYKKGKYPNICKDPSKITGYDDIQTYLNDGVWDLFDGVSIRFGSYGDPVRIPYPILEKMISKAKGFTGYTHQWQNGAFQAYKKYFMASVDTMLEYKKAKEMGWRTFRVSPEWTIKSKDEKPCEFSLNSTQCIDCLKCCGTTSNEKDIYVKVHGLKHKVNKFIEIFGDGNDGADPLTEEDKTQIAEIEKIAKETEEKEKKEKKLSGSEALLAKIRRK